MKILVIEDNPRLAQRIKEQLRKWYIVETAQSGDEGLRLVTTNVFDIVLLDLGLPDTSGLDVCRTIRSLSSDIPVLILTGVDTPQSRVALFEAGADDYVTKPFNLDELRARINALARRRKRSSTVSLIEVGDLRIDPGRRSVTRAGVAIELRRKEFDILEYLVVNKGRVVSRDMIINHAWHINAKGGIGSVDVHIKQLRDKIDRPFAYPLIKTLYGVGYMVDMPDDNNSKERRRSL